MVFSRLSFKKECLDLPVNGSKDEKIPIHVHYLDFD